MLQNLAVQLLQQSSSTPRELSKLLGMAQSASELIPLGKATLRPLQWLLSESWTPVSQEWDVPITLTWDFHDAIRVWSDVQWTMQGIPLESPPSHITLCTDASLTGWEAHILPEFVTVHQLWTPQESLLHINLWEMLAVERAIDHWLPRLQGQHIQILYDNTTVCAYIQHQGGMKSKDLCMLAVRLVQKSHASQIELSC